MISVKDLTKAIPVTLRMRVVWGSRFVTEFVREREEGLPKSRRLSKEKMNALQVIFTIWLLDRFLRDGTRAAEKAVSEFAELDVPGFQVGGVTFMKGNDEVENGKRLADDLRALIRSPEWFSLLDTAATVTKAMEVAYMEMSSA